MSDYREMMHQMLARRSNDVTFVVAALYKFVQLEDAPDRRAQLQLRSASLVFYRGAQNTRAR